MSQHEGFLEQFVSRLREEPAGGVQIQREVSQRRGVAAEPGRFATPTRPRGTFLGGDPESQARATARRREKTEIRDFERSLRGGFGGGGGFALSPGTTITQTLPDRFGGQKRMVVANVPGQVGGVAGAGGVPGAVGGAAGGGGLAGAFLDEFQKDVAAANEATQADREQLLQAISDFQAEEAGFRQSDIDTMISDTRQNEAAKNEQILRRIQEQQASAGRVTSPILLGQIAKRLAIESEDVIAGKRASLEIESAGLRLRSREIGLQLLERTLAGTQRDTLDPSQVLSIMQVLGRGTSQVAPFVA